MSYSRTQKRVPALIHAAVRVYGSWSNAVNASGLDYEEIRRYRRWTRSRIIERIRELHAQGVDLSWRHVATQADPPLAAATLRAGRFPSWNDALRAAGLDPERVARYRRWSLPKIREELKRLHTRGIPLDRETLNRQAPALLAAVYRLGNGLATERRKLREQAQSSHPVMHERNDWDTYTHEGLLFQYDQPIN